VSLTSVFGQPNRLQFKHLTPDDGLSSSIATSILQDHKGFVWIGTYDGLNRYDGFNFVVYKNNSADSSSLADNLVRTMIEDHNKNLLIGTNKGLCLYDREKDHFLNYMLDKSSPLRGITCIVFKIVEDSLGNLWIATNIGLIYFDRNNSKIIQYIHDPNNPSSLSYNETECVYIDKCDRLWVTTQRGLNLFEPKTGTFKHIIQSETKANNLLNTFFIGIIEDREGNLWFGSTEGLYCLKNNAENKITPFIHYRHNSQDKKSLSNNRVKSLFVDDSGNLWIGTENGGVNLFDRKNQRFWHYRMDEYDPKSLNNESITTIYQDNAGNLWVCTGTGGLNIAMKHGDAIIHYKTLPGAPLSLSHNVITCFLEDHLGQIWVGTDGGLNLFNDETNRFLRFNMDNSNLSSNAVLSIIEDSNNQIWLGTWAGGLVHFDSKTKSFTSFITKNSSIQDNNIYVIAEGDNNDLWLGSFDHGLIHYKIKENKFTNYTPSNSNICSNYIVVVRKDSQGHLFLGFTKGFQIFSPEDDRFITYTYNPKDTNSVSHPNILDILVENDSCVWIGTQDGLNRFNPKTESFIRYYEKDGLPDNVIKGLVLDKSGVLWVATNLGLCRFDYRQEKYKNFTKADGLQSNEFNFRSTLRTKSGALLMGGIKGFNMIYPEKIAENKSIPNVLITDLKIFNKSVEPGAKNSPLIQAITETKILTLYYTQSVLTFYFAVMDFTAPEKNQYAYRMENFDQKWIYSGNKREANYTNLDPGEYVFRVKGSNNDGVWNEEGTSIRITITPPFWQTAWFRVIGVIIVFSVLITGYKIRTARIRAHNRELGQRVLERTAQLEAANKELEAFVYSVSHDLRAPLRAIDGFTNILVEDNEQLLDEESKRVCAVICNETKRMGQLIDDLLSFSHISHAEMQVSSINMEAMVSTVFQELTTPESRERIDLQVASLPSAIGDLTLIRQVWMNLLSNAIKFSSKRERAVIEVGCQQDGQRFVYSVRDNGAGFDMQYADKLFTVFWRLHNDKEFEGTGVGLAIVQRLIHRHGGDVWAESQVDKGATFYFTLETVK
jgi:ligand-binding sensor domain-containing protein/signal transduction histidine kinase